MKITKLLIILIALALPLVVLAENDVLMKSVDNIKKKYFVEKDDSQGYQKGRLIVAPESDINDIFVSVIRAVPGLQEDFVVLNHCTGIPLQMYHKMVDSGRACRQYTDYRCFKACQYEKLGVSKDGIFNLKKLMAHFDTYFIGQRPHSIEAIKKAALHCLMKEDNTDTLSTTNCQRNELALECMHKRYFEICKPGDKIPQLKYYL